MLNIKIDKIDEKLYGDKTDYSDKENWLIIPEIEKEVDVFYVYPAAYINEEDEFLPFSKLHDENVKGAAKYFVKTQASAFEKEANIFVPLYRQFDPRYALKYIEKGKLDLVKELWSTDIIDSFKYYIENLNNNRPFILAGHSQGSRLLSILLETYLKDNKEAYENMIVAYIIGDSVTENYLAKNSHLKFAKGEEDFGVIVSWNVEHENITERNPVLESGAIAINPINWKRDETVAGADENLGSLMRKDIKTPGIADAKVSLDRGSVWCSTVDPKDFPPPMDVFPIGTYHSMDYAFYFNNLKDNVTKRVNAFLKNKK